ncbi:MAG: hypothetical protein LBE76_01480 [Nitrososphaerota archaeon]|nr:hypothetical protein [Nitrososphaerota archaeon]
MKFIAGVTIAVIVVIAAIALWQTQLNSVKNDFTNFIPAVGIMVVAVFIAGAVLAGVLFWLKK